MTAFRRRRFAPCASRWWFTVTAARPLSSPPRSV